MKKIAILILLASCYSKIFCQAVPAKTTTNSKTPTDSELIKQMSKQLLDLTSKVEVLEGKIEKMATQKEAEAKKEGKKEEEIIVGYFSLKKNCLIKLYDAKNIPIEKEEISDYKIKERHRLTEYERYKNVFIDSIFIVITAKKISSTTLFFEDNIVTNALNNNDFTDKEIFFDISSTEKVKLNDIFNYYSITSDDVNETLIKLSPKIKRVALTKK